MDHNDDDSGNEDTVITMHRADTQNYNVSNIQPVRWVMYFAPGLRQLKLRLRMRRRKSQVDSTGGKCKKGLFIKSFSFLTVVIRVDRNVCKVAKYEIELPSLPPGVLQVPYSIPHNYLNDTGQFCIVTRQGGRCCTTGNHWKVRFVYERNIISFQRKVTVYWGTVSLCVKVPWQTQIACFSALIYVFCRKN